MGWQVARHSIQSRQRNKAGRSAGGGEGEGKVVQAAAKHHLLGTVPKSVCWGVGESWGK